MSDSQNPPSSISLRTNEFLAATESYGQVASYEPDDPLREEMGWREVCKGLTHILVGYLLIVLCIFFSGIIVLLIFDQMNAAGAMPGRPDLLMLWVTHLGFGLIALTLFISYLIIISGKVRCAIFSSDRYGARWLTFATLVCMVMGPVLNTTISIAYQPTAEEMEKMQEMMMDNNTNPLTFYLTTPLGWVNLILSCISLAGTVFFLLFLRAVGACFRDKLLEEMVDYYLMFYSVILIGTLLCIVQISQGGFPTLILLGTGFGWFISWVWYLVLIFYARMRILAGLDNLKSPLEANL